MKSLYKFKKVFGEKYIGKYNMFSDQAEIIGIFANIEDYNGYLESRNNTLRFNDEFDAKFVKKIMNNFMVKFIGKKDNQPLIFLLEDDCIIAIAPRINGEIFDG